MITFPSIHSCGRQPFFCQVLSIEEVTRHATFKQVKVMRRYGYGRKDILMLTMYNTVNGYDSVQPGACMACQGYFSCSNGYNNIVIVDCFLADTWDEVDEKVNLSTNFAK